ncbi:MAG: hypothetical protein ABSH42_06010 [Bryobacteraceae bacterium]|jgi:hypothetical protein
MFLAWPVPQPDSTKANTKEADTRSVLLQEYADHGNWARHYSAVRMTLGTFFLTAATGMITLRWDKPQPAVAVAAGAILSIGVLLFLVFSRLTFDEMNKQRTIVDSYRDKLRTGNMKVTPKLHLWKTRTGLPIAVLFVVAFASFDLWWLFASQPKPSRVTQITVPMKVKVGQQPEVVVDVPITVTAP